MPMLMIPKLRPPRVRFRLFLLLVTLASVIAASFAVRARVADGEAAFQHAMRVDRAWNAARMWAEIAEGYEANAEKATTAEEKANWRNSAGAIREEEEKAAEKARQLERLGRR